VTDHRAAVGRAKVERPDDVALALDAFDDKIAPSGPAPRRRRLRPVDLGLAANEDLGQEPVGLAPGLEDRLAGGILEDLGDGLQ
jgi:hypothetical protein